MTPKPDTDTDVDAHVDLDVVLSTHSVLVRVHESYPKYSISSTQVLKYSIAHLHPYVHPHPYAMKRKGDAHEH